MPYGKGYMKNSKMGMKKMGMKKKMGMGMKKMGKTLKKKNMAGDKMMKMASMTRPATSRGMMR